MITFTNPAFLWGFSALAIPLAIHLLSRKEGKVIYVGSLRHLQESNTRQSLNIRLNELLLMALRMVMIAMVVLLISGLHWQSNTSAEKKWLLMEDGLQKDPRLKNLVDSLSKNQFETHFLATGFPLMNDSLNISNEWNFKDLLGALNKEKLTEAIIFSSNHFRNFSGKRMKLPAYVTWIPVESLPADFDLRAVRESPSNVYLTKGHTDADQTSFETIKVNPSINAQTMNSTGDTIKITSPWQLTVLIVSDSSFKNDATIMKAGLKAIQNASYAGINVMEIKTSEFNSVRPSDWIIWLSENKYAGKDSDKRIVFSDDHSAPLMVKHTSHEWLLSQHLNEGLALKENLPLTISGIIFPAKEEWKRAMQFDRRSADEVMIGYKENAESSQFATATHQQDASTWVLSLLILTVLIERMIAHNRNQ